ncbi:hypothetical protein KDL01_18110 [Actinospica durhamensis]|uniref:Uncharacterized protein n=1 Tax=Actinospica durhamensis TaxID=1508375 RepID=A0A941EQB1_9ACTN|nr:hypothetical protein [Actinospica durhamensis]MBR7835193.1 hypothetical protein [Actinospica durhamensis]
MDDPILELRRWLRALTPDEARQLAELQQIRRMAQLAQNSSGRRAASSIQAWAARTTPRELKSLAEFAVGWARDTLAADGWPVEVIGDPNRNQLVDMLAALDPALAIPALLGLVAGTFPASALAAAEADELLVIARSPRRSQRSETSSADLVDTFEPDNEDELQAGELLADARQAGATLSDAAVSGLDFAEALAAFEETRELFREHLATMGITWNAADGFDAAEHRVAEHVESRRAQRIEGAARAQLVKRQDQLSQALNSDVTPEVRTVLETELSRIREQLSGLTTAPVAGDGAVASSQDLDRRSVDGSTACDVPAPIAEPGQSQQQASRSELDRPATTGAQAPGRGPLVNDAESAAVPAPPLDDQPASSLAVGAEKVSPQPIDEALADFIQGGRFDEAWHLTVASHGYGPQAEAFAYAAAAFRCRSVEQAETVAVTFDGRWQAERFRGDPIADAVVTVAAIRLGSAIAWPPAPLVGRSAAGGEASAPGDAESTWWALADAAASVVRHRGSLPSGEPGVDEAAGRRSVLAEQARTLMEQLPKRRVKYNRATMVLRHLMRGVIEETLTAVREWAEGRATSDDLRTRTEYWRSTSPDDLIDKADHELSVLVRDPIEAGARQRLRQHLQEVGTTVATALALADAVMPETAGQHEGGLRRVLNALASHNPPAGAEFAAFGFLRDWLSGKHRAHGSGEISLDDPLRPDPTPLLAAPALWRHGEGPNLDDAIAIANLISRRPLDGLLASYEQRGDVGLARRLLAEALRGTTPAVEIPTRSEAEALERRVTATEQRYNMQRRAEYRTVTDLSARLLAMNLNGTDGASSGKTADEADFRGRLQALVEPPADGAYGRVLGELKEIGDQLRSMTERVTDGMRRDLEARTQLSDEDKSRIAELLDKGDVVAARELMTILETEGLLPQPTPSGASSGLAEFVSLLAKAESEVKPQRSTVGARWFAEQAASRNRFDDAVNASLEGWDRLPNGLGVWQRDLPGILRILGLDCRSSQITVESRGGERLPVGVLRLRARLQPPRDGYLAAFGSQAPTHFTLYLVTNPTVAERPLKIVKDWPESGPVIILCPRPVWSEARNELLAETRRAAAEVLLIDSAVFGWVAARGPQSFRAMQHVTLPWTGLNPYTPFAAGRVPPEVFHGRTAEMRDIASPYGPMFVYGGRQLGKSALLRRVAEEFGNGGNHIAVYVDLKSKGIGEEEPAERVWRVLADQLHQHGVVSSDRTGENATPTTVATAIQRWLRTDPDRRILFLADEADAFLTADHRETVPFRTFTSLLGLINETDGRFKAVFAGLHQVQRFIKTVPNVSLAHGGAPICIGPLDAASARRLIVDPLAAVGYVFGDDADRLVWRIFAHTNGQACLLQIFCDALVRRLATRESSSGLPSLIREEDVELAAQQVRPVLAERLRFTINLQDRYRLLMLILALKSVDDGYSRGYGTTELLDEARVWWPDGFGPATPDEVDVTLGEMVGLGVVVRRGEHRYAVRSPNLVAMLGSRESLEAELEAESFDSPYEYDPDLARRTLQLHGPIRQVSPLTERQLREALSPGVRQLVVTDALGGDRIRDALESYAQTANLDIDWADAERLAVRIAEIRRRGRRSVVVVDARGVDLTVLADSVELAEREKSPAVTSQAAMKTESRSERSVLFIVSPSQSAADCLLQTPRIRPARWSTENLKSWPDCPATNAESRAALIQASGGWFDQVESIIAKTEDGIPLNDVQQDWLEAMSDARQAKSHLRRAGVGARALESLRTWVDCIDGAESEPELVALLDDDGCGEARLRELDELGILDRGPDGTALDPATLRAVLIVGSTA